MNTPTNNVLPEHDERRPTLSVVIPVFCSARIVPEVLKRLDAFFAAHPYSHEIIFVNDGSPDESWKVLEGLAGDREDLVMIDLMRNYGQHSAILCGLAESRGEFVVTMDDDLQNPPEELIHLIRKIQEAGYDVVFGEFHQKMHGPLRKLGSRLVRWLNTRLFDKPPGLVLTNFRIIRREAVDAVCAQRTSFPYLPGLLLTTAKTFANVPVEHHSRADGRSNYTAGVIAQLLWRIVFNYSSFPLRVLCGIGLLAALGSFSLGAFYLGRGLIFGTKVPGWTSLVVLISFYQGLVLLILGVLGEYIVRLINESASPAAYRIRHLIRREPR